jgi:hypothetical protein
MDVAQLTGDSWQLEPKEVFCLIDKIHRQGVPLREFTGAEPLSGIKTGLNEAYLLDNNAYKRILDQGQECSGLLKPYLRGQDFSRWQAGSTGLWMIVMASSENRDWPWSNLGSEAETAFVRMYPAIQDRQDQGRYWWELRSCAYWAEFERPKIMFPEISWRLEWCLDSVGTLCNNTAYLLPTDDSWVLAAANVPITWWFARRRAIHGKDEALRFIKAFVQDLPIPRPTPEQRQAADCSIHRLIEITSCQQQTKSTLLDWLKVEYAIEKPSNKLLAVTELDSDTWVGEVKRIRGKKLPLTAAGVQALRAEYTRSVEPARTLAAETLKLERSLSHLVNQAYGLTQAEINLMWKTAPPRMPFKETDSHASR